MGIQVLAQVGREGKLHGLGIEDPTGDEVRQAIGKRAVLRVLAGGERVAPAVDHRAVGHLKHNHSLLGDDRGDGILPRFRLQQDQVARPLDQVNPLAGESR